jgi:hypothetical protein
VRCSGKDKQEGRDNGSHFLVDNPFQLCYLLSNPY